MHVELAIRHYQGKDGARKLNCAQSVVAAFQESRDIPEEQLQALAGFGVGRAPGGVCGAYHSAVLLSGGETEQLKEAFIQEAGSLQCREIRALRKLPCAGCVAHGARLVQEAEYQKVHAGEEEEQSAS